MALTALRAISFRVQLALLFGTIVIVVASLLSLVLGRMVSQTVRTEASHSLEVVANNAAHMLAEGLQDRMLLAQNLANSNTLWERGLGSPEVVNTMARQQAIRENIAWMGVADTAGVVQAATHGMLVGVDVSARPWFSAGLAGVHVGDVHDAKLLSKMLPNARNGEPQRFVDFAAPILREGRVMGVLALHGSWDWAYTVIDAMLPRDAEARGLEVFIFDRQGTMIFAPGDRFNARDPRTQRLPVLPSDDSGSSVIAWSDGNSYLTSTAPVEPRNTVANLGWTVAARLPAATALAGTRSAVRNVLIIGVAATLLAALLAWVVAGNVSHPLSRIAHAAHAVQDGVAGAAIPRFRSSPELAELSEALAGMTARLLTANEALETRVAARTAELESANAELARLARFDPLTELYNRRGFEDQMKAAVASARRRHAPLAVLMVDADHFKRVNDTHGHATGDEVLRTLARLMKGRLRDSDVIGRIGGEEFAALLPDTDLANARRLADDLVRIVGATMMPIVGHVTISCGVTSLHDGDEDSAALKRADAALYRAKSHGRNRASFQNTSLEADTLG